LNSIIENAFLDEFIKIAEDVELITSLKPHQQRVVDRLKTSPGLVVAHGLGSGKTLSSIAAALSEGDTRVLVPAALMGNYNKELEKHVKGPHSIHVGSIQKAVNKGEIPPSKLLVVDEAHRIRNTGTKTYNTLRNAPAEKRLLLTGSPIYNRPSDIAPLVNFVSGAKTLPLGKEFDTRYIAQPSKGFTALLPWSRKEPELKNKEELRKVLRKWVDYHASSGSDFPTSIEERVEAPMSSRQQKLHSAAWGSLPFLSRWRLKAGLPPGKEDLSGLNAFQSQARQIASTESPFSKEHTELTPKIQKATRSFIRALHQNPNHKAVVYSNYLNTLKDYASALEQQGIPHGIFSGEQSQKVRLQQVKDYNEGKLKALLLSSAGGEGLDLKGTRQVQVLEPHWNDEKIKQVIGRAIRTGSHSHLPENERNVRVQRFESYPTGIFGGKKRGVEQVLYGLSRSKERLNQQVRQLLQNKMDKGTFN
jgi:SNF2 family DNA or RNA helicase